MKFNNIKKICVLSIMLFWGCESIVYSANSEYLQLIMEGRPMAFVLLPAQASAGEKKAAEELVRYVREISGTDIKIQNEPDYSEQLHIISIGRTKLAKQAALANKLKDLPPDSFLIKCIPQENRLYLMGNSDLGNIMAVYGFLRGLGVHWFMPDDLGRVIPKEKTLEIKGMEEISSPDIPYRAVGITKVDQWSIFNGSNVNIDENFGAHFYKFAHTFFDFLPPEKYFKNHPEFFSLVKGERIPKQLCTSNPGVIAQVSKNILALTNQRPEIDVVTLFPQDGLGFCECKKCKALDEEGLPTVEDVNKRWQRLGPDRYRALSRRMLIFYLAVAENVLKNNNGIYLQVGAYNPYLYPPIDNTFKAPKRMMVEMCHGFEHNRPIVSKDSQTNMRFFQAFSGWQKIFDHISIYEYYWKLAMNDLPFPILHSIQEDISFFAKHKIQSFYTQFGTDYYTNGHNYYIASRLLWDSDQSVWTILDEFCQKLYENAWEPMRDYYLNYEKAAMASGIDLAPPVDQLDRIFTTALLKNQEELLQKAGTLAGNSQVQERIRRVKISLSYTRMCMDYLLTAKEMAKQSGVHSSLKKLEAQAAKIKSFRKANVPAHCFNRDNNYTDRLFNATWLLKQVSTGERKTAAGED